MGRTAHLQLSARFTGGLRPTQARLVTRVQPERVAVRRVGTPHAAHDRIPRRACGATQGTSSSTTTTCFEEGVLCAAPGWDGKHSEWGEPSFGSVKRRQGDRVPLASTPVPDGAASGVSATQSEAPVGLRLRPQYRRRSASTPVPDGVACSIGDAPG